MILVAGGTGMLGTRIVNRLIATGEQVRVLTRDAQRARHLPAGVQLAIGDVRRGSLDAAVDGCACVVSAVHGFLGGHGSNPASVDRDGNGRLIAAAVRAGAGRFVLVSVAGAAADHPMSLHRMKYAAEEQLRQADLTGVIVRATAFLQTWQAIVGGKLAGGGPALVFGPGRNPINFVSADDVAAFVLLAIAGDPRVGSELTVAGPQDLTLTEFAQRLLARQHRTGPIKHVPLAALRAMSILARPVRPALARQARAAIVMNTADLALGALAHRDGFPEIPATSIDHLAGSGLEPLGDLRSASARGLDEGR